MANLSDSVLACAGEFYTDLVFFGLEQLPRLGEEVKTDCFCVSPGGGAAITAGAASQLGRTATLTTVFGQPAFGSKPEALLAAAGIGTACCRTLTDSHSGITVSVSARDDRSFVTHPGANKKIENHLLRRDTFARLTDADHVHFALTPTRWEAFAVAVAELRRRGTTTSWDLGWNPAAGRSAGFRNLCETLDVVFLNEMEGLCYADASSTDRAVERLATPANVVVIKCGKDGAIASDRGSAPVRANAIEVDAIETTGAGDAFNGGFLNAWMNGTPVKDALVAGNICGGMSTRRAGGWDGLPTRAEFERELRRFGSRGTGGTRRL